MLSSATQYESVSEISSEFTRYYTGEKLDGEKEPNGERKRNRIKGLGGESMDLRDLRELTGHPRNMVHSPVPDPYSNRRKCMYPRRGRTTLTVGGWCSMNARHVSKPYPRARLCASTDKRKHM